MMTTESSSNISQMSEKIAYVRMGLPEKLHTNKNSCIQNNILPMVSLDYSLISGGDIVVVYLLNVVDELDEW